MVSKLGLAVCENFFAAIDSGADTSTIDALKNHFREVRAGIGAEKSPTEYGAFASDAYSHTPENAGAKQPGMTGQVKEDILARFAELGAHIDAGCVNFRFDLFDNAESLAEPQTLSYCDLNGQLQHIDVPANSYAFTLCQTPIVCQTGPRDGIHIEYASADSQSLNGLKLDAETSQKLFARTGEITRLTVTRMPT